MEIHVFANQQRMGPFTETAVVDMARLGTLPTDAMVWHEGVTEWVTLAQFLEGQRVEIQPERAVAVAELMPVGVGEGEGLDGDGSTASGMFVLRGLGAGFGMALVAGGIWVGASISLGFRIPIIGLVIGWLIGWAMSKASREEGATILPVAAVVFTLMTYGFFLMTAPLSFWGWLSCAFACFNAWRAAAN